MFRGVRGKSRLSGAGDKVRTRAKRFLGIELLESRSLLALLGQELFPVNNPWNQNVAAAPLVRSSYHAEHFFREKRRNGDEQYC